MINENQTITQTTKPAVITLILGLASLLLFAAAIILGFLVETIGIVNLLNFALIPALITIILGAVAYRKPVGRRIAMSGIILACVTLILIFVARISVFLFFIPWLGA